ncbi:MAG: helix-turn-helix transcriptional regulator, partial [Desulfobulbus sp.]
MAKYKPQHARLLFIDRQIREKHYPNCAGLAREWEVNPRTIRRDIDYLRYQLDAPLAYSALKRGYYYTEEQFQLPAIQIRERDLFALYLADKLLAQYEGTPIYDSLQSVFAKIEDSLPDNISLSPGPEQSLFTIIPPSVTVILPEVLESVFSALRGATRLRIVYRSPGADPMERTIDPYHCVRYEGDWYVLAHCHLR